MNLDHNRISYRLADDHQLSSTPSSPSNQFEIRHITPHEKPFHKIALERIRALNEERLVTYHLYSSFINIIIAKYNDIDQFAEYVDISKVRDVTLVMINIICDFGINTGRLCSEGGGWEDKIG